MRAIRLVGRTISIVLTFLLATLLICNLYLIAAKAITGKPQPTIFGYSMAVVVSGSMSGSIEIDDMVVAHRQESYVPGDIIVFESGSSVVTHRIVDRSDGGYITKGDANNAADLDPVPEERVIGRVVLVVPKIGLLIAYLRTPLGMASLVLIGLLLIEFPTLAERIRAKNTGGRYHGKFIK
ncbi:MAG: signal peptidase I [Faecousia sp.]